MPGSRSLRAGACPRLAGRRFHAGAARRFPAAVAATIGSYHGSGMINIPPLFPVTAC